MQRKVTHLKQNVTTYPATRGSSWLAFGCHAFKDHSRLMAQTDQAKQTWLNQEFSLSHKLLNTNPRMIVGLSSMEECWISPSSWRSTPEEKRFCWNQQGKTQPKTSRILGTARQLKTCFSSSKSEFSKVTTTKKQTRMFRSRSPKPKR